MAKGDQPQQSGDQHMQAHDSGQGQMDAPPPGNIPARRSLLDDCAPEDQGQHPGRQFKKR